VDGKGLSEPLNILATVRPEAISQWLPQCRHRTAALQEIRLLAQSAPEIRTILRDNGSLPWKVWLENPKSTDAQIEILPVKGKDGPPFDYNVSV